MKLAIALFTLVPLSAVASPSADETATSGPVHDGLYMQFTPGVGVAATAAKLDDGSTVSLAGAGGSFGIAIGAALSHNWILAADLSGTSVFGPTFKKGDMEVKTDDDIKWNTAYVGAMAAYYVMPINLRISGGLGALRMALDVPHMDLTRSNFGVAAKLGVGKEWWLGNHWGLGVNLEAVAGAIPDDSTSGKGWGFFSTDLAVSATYN
jgi:hypothetical protein